MNHKVFALVIFVASLTFYGCAAEAQPTDLPAKEPAEITAQPTIVDPDQQIPAAPKELEMRDPLLISPLDPIAGEEDMIAGPVMVKEIESILKESNPVQVLLRVAGDLPTPCHILRATLTHDAGSKRIEIELYSLTEEDLMCIQVIQSFETIIPLGEYSPGDYEVYLNGDLVDEIKL